MISPEELSRLWRAHAAGLELLARSRCREAEDCVQEAFVRLSCAKPQPDDPVAWLARVVRNGAISRSRSEARRRRREQIAAEYRPPWFYPESIEPSDVPSAIELQNILQRVALDEREVLIAHVWGGLTFRQLETAFETPRTTLHRRYLSALQFLRTELGVSLEHGHES